MRAMMLGIVVLLAGCATQNYGRLPAVGPEQEATLTCDQIALEIAKTKDYLAQIEAQHDRVTPSDFTGFFGDLGIGNAVEFSNAEKSGMDRLIQLGQLRATKCPSHPS